MWIAETIDLDNHDSVVKFMKNQSDKIEKLEKENEQLKQENKELKKRDDLVSSYLQDEGSITLEKYEEIVHYLYKEWKKKRDLE